MKDGMSTETNRRIRRCTRAGGSVGLEIKIQRARHVNLVVRHSVIPQVRFAFPLGQT
jgi:hypothetical protein